MDNSSGMSDSDSGYTPIISYVEYNLLHSFNSLINNPANGDWTLYICDHDYSAVGFIYDWKLYITYNDIFES